MLTCTICGTETLRNHIHGGFGVRCPVCAQAEQVNHDAERMMQMRTEQHAELMAETRRSESMLELAKRVVELEQQLKESAEKFKAYKAGIASTKALDGPAEARVAKHGLPGPIRATRVFAKEMTHLIKDGIQAHSIAAIQKSGLSVGMNVYNGKCGASYDPAKYTQRREDMVAFVGHLQGKGYVEMSWEQVARMHFSGNLEREG